MNKVNTVAAVVGDPALSFPAATIGDPALNFSAPPAKEPVVAEVKPAPVQDQADFRLVIEEDASGSFVYKTMDRRTGEVIQQFPREQILQLKESAQYIAGSVINARA